MAVDPADLGLAYLGRDRCRTGDVRGATPAEVARHGGSRSAGDDPEPVDGVGDVESPAVAREGMDAENRVRDCVVFRRPHWLRGNDARAEHDPFERPHRRDP